MLASCASVLLAPPAKAQLDLGFETAAGTAGWRFEAGEAALDAQAARGGQQSLRLSARAGEGRARFAQAIPADSVDGDRLRISAYIKGAAGALWVRIDGPAGLLYVDSTRDRGAPRNADWTRAVIEAPVSASAQRISFGGEARGGTVWFDDFAVEQLRAAALPAPTNAARRYVEQALSLIQQSSVRRKAVDWKTFRAAAMTQSRGASSAADAHLAVRFALAELHDGHSYFMAPRQMQTLAERPVGNARTGRERDAARGLLLAGAAGYIALPGFAGGTHADQAQFAETLQNIVADLDSGGACGWILDLRANSGGNLWPMLAGIGPLLGDGDVGASIMPNGERTTLWYRDGKAGLGDRVQLRVRSAPYRLRRTHAPVAVITSRATASAAEVIAGAFEARAATRSFGAPTRGAVTATRIFPLADGAALVLAVGLTADRNGDVYEGPLVPDEPAAGTRSGRARSTRAAAGTPVAGGAADRARVEEPGASDLEDQEAVGAALRWLASAHGCGHTPSG